MASTLVYRSGSEPPALTRALQGARVLRSGSLAQLTRTLVSESDLRCLVFVAEPAEARQASFLTSVSRSFAVLSVCVLSPAPLPGLPDRYLILDLGTSEAELASSLKGFLAQCGRSERRALPRFDWPLRASLSLGGTDKGIYRLRALSGSGAFMGSSGVCPDPGTTGRLQVLFQNFTLSTDCQVLDRRQASSNLPFGFGVRFVGMSEEAKARLDRIVRDALVQSLLEPETPPEIPSLGGEEALPGGFEIR
jgi:hypothetical protein